MNTKKYPVVLVVLFGVLLLAGVCRAQTGPELIMKPFAPGLSLEMSSQATVFNQMGTNQPQNDAALVMNETSFRFKVPQAPLKMVVGYDQTWIHLDTDNTVLPRNLLDQSMGVGLELYKTDSWTFTGAVAAGFAGDDPYADARGIYAKLNLMGTYQIDAKSSLMLTLNYQGNREFMPDVPLPGIGYMRIESPSFWYIVGAPLSEVHWMPMEKLKLEMRLFMLTDLSASASYSVLKNVDLFTAYNNESWAFQLHDQGDNRLFYQQQRAEAGVRWYVWEHLSVTMAGGYAFGQEMKTGFDLRDTNTLSNLGDAFYGRGGVEWGF